MRQYLSDTKSVIIRHNMYSVLSIIESLKKFEIASFQGKNVKAKA